MRIESSVTSISWIPSGAITGLGKLPFELAFHYDDPPPERIEDLGALRETNRFRFANELRAWIEVEDGRVVGYGHLGTGHMGSTTLRLGPTRITFAAVALPTLRPPPEVTDDSVRFVQTVGGRTGVGVPRPIPESPFFRVAAPIVWTTLALTISADGRSTHELVGASPFPRHWIYDASGKHVQKSGLMDLHDWTRHAFPPKTPWGKQDWPTRVTEAETPVERQLSRSIMRGALKPRMRNLARGETLVEQGEQGDELFLLLDGLLTVEVDGETLAEVGPGAILGERAILEDGKRTATLRALTPCRVAVVREEDVAPDFRGLAEAFGFEVASSPYEITRDALARVAEGHRREEQTRTANGTGTSSRE